MLSPLNLKEDFIMKRYPAIFLAVFIATTFGIPRPANAQVSVGVGIQINSVSDFTSPLTPYGSWVTVGSFGRCWRPAPARIAVGWRPYSVGPWVWTDAGWFWQSDEPWAWATYHYGSWTMDPTW